MKLLHILFISVLLIQMDSGFAAQSEDGKSYVSWEQVQKDSLALAEMVKDKGPFVGIVAIARGGFIPAVIVAHRLKIKKMEVFSLTSYKGDQQQGGLIIHKEFKDQGRWLVVDELVDSGNTLREVRKHLPNAHFAVVYAKPKGVDAVDTFVSSRPQDEWIVLPWEED